MIERMTRSALERNGDDSKELVVAAGVILDNPTVVDISSTVVVEGMMCYAEVKTNRVVVSGRFHGSVHASSLEVSKGGWFAGRAFVRTATVAGKLEGVLVASDALMVRSAGQCRGTIRYGELNVQHGSKLTGNVKAKSLVEEGIATRQMLEVPSAWNRDVSVGDGIRHSKMIASRIFGGKSTRSNFRHGGYGQRSNSSTRVSTRESSRRPPAVTDPPPCGLNAMVRTDRARSVERGVMCPSRDAPSETPRMSGAVSRGGGGDVQDVPVEGGVRAGTGGGGGIDPVGSGGWGALRDPPAVDTASPGASELDMFDFFQESGDRRVKEDSSEGVTEEGKGTHGHGLNGRAPSRLPRRETEALLPAGERASVKSGVLKMLHIRRPLRDDAHGARMTHQEAKDGVRRYEPKANNVGSQAQGRGIGAVPSDPVIVVVAPTHPEAVANDTSPMSTSGAGSYDVAPPEETRGPPSNGAELGSGDAKGGDAGGSCHQVSSEEDLSGRGRARARAVAAAVAINGDDEESRAERDRVITKERQRLRKENHARRMMKRRAVEEAQQIRAMAGGGPDSSNRAVRAAERSPRDAVSSAPAPSLAPRASPRRPNLKLGSGEERSPVGLHSPFRARFRSIVASESPIPRRPKIAVPTVLPQWIANDSSTPGEVESGTAPGSGSSAFPAPSPSGGGTEAEAIGERGHEKGEGEAFPVRGGVSPTTSWERVTPTSKDRPASAHDEEEIRLIPAFGGEASSSVDRKAATPVEPARSVESGPSARVRTDSRGARIDGANGRRTKGESSSARGVELGGVDAPAPERAKASSSGASGASGARGKRGDRKHRSSRRSGSYDGETKRAAAATTAGVDRRTDKKGSGVTDGTRISPTSTPRSADRSKLRLSPSRTSRDIPVERRSTPRSPRATSPRAAPISPASQAADGAVAAARQAVKSAKEVERRTKGEGHHGRGHHGRGGSSTIPLSQHEKRDVAASHLSPVRSRTGFKHAASTKPASRTGSGSSSSTSSLLGTAPVSPIVSSERSVERLAEQSSRATTVVPQRYSRRGSCRSSQGSDLRSAVSVRSDDSRASGSKADGVRSSPTISRCASDPPVGSSRTSGRRSRHAGAGSGDGGATAGSSSHCHVPRVRRDEVVQDMDENESFEERRERWLAPFTSSREKEKQNSASLSCRRVPDRKDISSGGSTHGSGSASSLGASRKGRGSTSSDGLAGSKSGSDRRGSTSSLSSSGAPWAAPTESTMKKHSSAGATRASTASHASKSWRSSSANGRRSRTSTERTKHTAATAGVKQAVQLRDAATAKAEETARIAKETAQKAEKLKQMLDEMNKKEKAMKEARIAAARETAAAKEAAARADARAAVLAEEKANAQKNAVRRTASAKATGDAKGRANSEGSADPATGGAASAKSGAENSVAASDNHERRSVSLHIDVTERCDLSSLSDRAIYPGIAASADTRDAQGAARDVPARYLEVGKRVTTDVQTSLALGMEAFGVKSDSKQELKAGEALQGLESEQESGNRAGKPSLETLPIVGVSSVELPAAPAAVVTSVTAAEEDVAGAATPSAPETHVSLAAEEGVEDGLAVEASGEPVVEERAAGAGKLETTTEAARAPETAPEVEENADDIGAQVKSTAAPGGSNAAAGKDTFGAMGGDEFDGIVDEVVDEVGEDIPESPGAADPAPGESEDSQAATVRLFDVLQDKEEKAAGEDTGGEAAKITGDAEDAKSPETAAQQSPEVRSQAGENSNDAGLPATSDLFVIERARRKSAPLRGTAGVDLSKGVALLRRPVNRAQPGQTGDAPGSALGLLRHPGASSSPTRPPIDLPRWQGGPYASMGNKGMPRVESEPGMLASAGVPARPRMVAGQHMKDRSVFKDPGEVKQGLGPAGAFASKGTWRLDFEREKKESAAAAKSDGQGGFHNPMAAFRAQQQLMNNNRARRASDAPKGSSPLGNKLQDSNSDASSTGEGGDSGSTPASSPLTVPPWVRARVGNGGLRSPSGMLRTRTAQGRLGSKPPSETSSTSPLLTSAAAGRSRRPEEVMTTAAVAAGMDALSKSDDEDDEEEAGLSVAALVKGREHSKEDTRGVTSVGGSKPEGPDADKHALGKDNVAVECGGDAEATENPAGSAPEEGPAAGRRSSVDSHDAVDRSPKKDQLSPSKVTVKNAGVGVENGRRHRLTVQGEPGVVDAGDESLEEREKDGEGKAGVEEVGVAAVCSPAASSFKEDDAVGGLVAAELTGGPGGDKSGTKLQSFGTKGAMVQAEMNSMAEGVGAPTEETGVTVLGDDPWDESEVSKRSPPGGLAALGRFLFGGPNPPPSRFLPTSAVPLDGYPIGDGTGSTGIMSEALAADEDDPLGLSSSSSSGTKVESDLAPNTDPETGAPPERASAEVAVSVEKIGSTGGVGGIRPASGGGADQNLEEEGEIVDAGQTSSSIVVPTVGVGSDGADGKCLGRDHAGELAVAAASEWRASDETPVDPRTNPLSAHGDDSTSNSTERPAPLASGPEPVRVSKSRSRFFASSPKEEGRAPEVASQPDGSIRVGGDLASRLELVAGDVQGHARDGGESVEKMATGLPSSPQSGEQPVPVTSVVEGTVSEEGLSGPGADRAQDAGGEDAETETPVSLRPRPCSPAQTVTGANGETRDKKDVGDRSEARSASKAGDARVAIAPPSADRGRGTSVNARRILSSASRTEKARDRSRRIVEASGGASGTGLRSSMLSRSKSPGPRKRGSRPVLVRSPSLLSGERKTGLAALEDQGVANRAARRAILEETKQRRNAESRQRPGIFETLRQRSVGNLEHRDSNRRALGGNRRRDEVSPRSERRGSSTTSFSASASPVMSASGAAHGVSPREEAPIAVPALARRRTDGDKLGRVVDSRPVSKPREASEESSASTAKGRKGAESVEKELELEVEVEAEVDENENEVEGGDDTEDSEEEPDFWAKYGIIDDSALDEDAEIEI